MEISDLDLQLKKYVEIENNLIRQNQVFLKISKIKEIDDGNVLEAIREITEIVSETIKCERVSIWLLNPEKTLIESIDLFEREPKKHTGGVSIFAEDFPIYFENLFKERAIVANDANENEATLEFKDVYLVPNKITSMLDAPIRVAGELVGVLCNEHIGPKREWKIDEIYFCGVISDVISRLLEAEKRKEAIEQSNLVKRNLEKLVMARTTELNQLKEENEKLKINLNGDLYLTSLIESPLSSNRNRSNKVITEFLIEQQNKFQFRNTEIEIGGDICISGNLYFENYKNRYIAFINSDAMGKSIQGATGAIVLGTAFNQILHNSAKGGKVLTLSPENWLKETFQELNYLFQTFNGSMMVSCVIGLIGENKGDTYLINSDHPNPILYRDKSASFLFNPNYIPRLGTQFSLKEEIMQYTLLEGDILIIGSDGREDIKMKQKEQEENVQVEDLILEQVEKLDANLSSILESIKNSGIPGDDISFIKISYKIDSVENPQLKTNEYLSMPFPKVIQMVKNKDFERSLPFLLSYTQSDPENSKYWNTLGVVYFHLGKYLNSDLAFSNALEFSPGNKGILKNMKMLKSKINSLEN